MDILKKRVIGIDCGTAIVGWSVLDKVGSKLIHIDSGAVITEAKTDMSLRLKKIYEELDELIKKYKPNEMAIEDLFFFKNEKTVISVGQGRGVIILSGATNDLKVYDYTPLQVKSAVTGYGRADKDQVQFMVGKILKMKEVPKLDDITDAIAVSICHLNTKY